MANDTMIAVPSTDPMPVTTGRSEQVAIRLPHDHIERTKAILEALTRPGLEAPSFAEVMRAVVAKGIEAWEKELGIKAPSNGKAKGKTAKR
jgi:predicted glycosyl hydrolase (DUF1957 family)